MSTGERGLYVALSYCWGSSRQVMLQSSALRSATHRLDFDDLPQTIKDAIEVTRSLSIKYLWVDTLCIVQDDEADKTREMGLMAQIYGNAHLTIVASMANNASEGFLGPRKRAHDCAVSLPFRVSPNVFGSVKLQDLRPLVLHRPTEPVDRRAWCLQEQLVSRRLLLYQSKTLQWRCSTGLKNLGNSLCADSIYSKSWLLSQLSTNPKDASEQWQRIVCNYSSRTASLYRDKLPALAAVAERFAPFLGKYYAGIWSYDMIQQLVWYWADEGTKNLNSNTYRAPSWSWASVDGTIGFNGFSMQDNQAICALISTKIVPKHRSAPFGEVLEGSITIRAKSLLVWTCGYDAKIFSAVDADCSVQKSAMVRLLKTYFRQSFSSTARRENPVSGTHIIFDDGDHSPTRPSKLIYILPLVVFEPRMHKDVKYCSGIILIPASPNTFRRVGFFNSASPDELMHLPDQDFTIT
ncbi:heterokaryon incompatibility protein-domain-containing protein [Phaeosphaeriaceae sp. PMI808]|nr:heterokaryon incompatibility protein-domain-containing protein [Phaeosphaeriaceae sp. PMI808]